jgi:hypothetical protein
MRVIMTAANCNPAVPCRRAKYDGKFRVQTLLNAQPLNHTARALQTRHAKYQHGS